MEEIRGHTRCYRRFLLTARGRIWYR